MKQGSRTLVIFLILTILILGSVVAISFFLLSKETRIRQETEATLSEAQERSAKIDAALQEAQKEIDVLRGKNNDADDKINSLMEERDLDKALRDKMKEENKKLKDALEVEAKAKIEQRDNRTGRLEAVQSTLKDVEAKAVAQVTDLQQKLEMLQKKNAEMEESIKNFESGAMTPPSASGAAAGQGKVDLDRIVITPETAKEGRVLNVDTETEFLIFDLGSKHGIKQGDTMSVYRGKTYLGDVKVTRIQDEMSAADLIPPFSSRKVRKNDQVVPKRETRDQGQVLADLF